jgi:hypothetical protein
MLKDIRPLSFGDVRAQVVHYEVGSVVRIEDANLPEEYLVADEAEAIALRNWLNEVLG